MAETGQVVGTTAQGAAGGAMTGAAIGAAGGPIGVAGGAVIGGLGGLLGGLFGGGGGDDGRLRLPYQLEVQLMRFSQQNYQRINQSIARMGRVTQAYDRQLSSLQNYANSMIAPRDLLRELATSTVEIAQAFGNNTLEAIQNGFIDEETARITGLIEEREGVLQDNLAQLESADFNDPVLEGQLSDRRAELDQQLARQGLSPAQRAQAISRFERDATEMRFTRTEQLRTEKFSRLTSGFAMGADTLFNVASTNLAGRNQVFNQAIQGLNASLGVLQNQGQNISASAGIAGQRLEGNIAGETAQVGFGQQALNQFETLGKFDFSGDAKKYLSDNAKRYGLVQNRPTSSSYQSYQRNRLMSEAAAGRVLTARELEFIRNG